MKKLKCWKRNQKSGYPRRWDNGDHVVVLNPILKGGNKNYEIIHSHSVGGWHHIDYSGTVDGGEKKAIEFMKNSDSC